MPKSRREKKRARREAKRKAKRKAIRRRSQPRGKKAMLRASLAWPVMECWVNEDWEDPTKLNQVIVARRNPATGEVYAGTYLVDRACLGVKNADVANFIDAGEFRRELLSILGQTQELIQIDFNLAAKIVKAGIEYAAQFGFHPHRDYREASILLRDADPDAVDVDIAVGGPEGKPFFVAGPYDNVDKIMTRLAQQLGPDDFNFTMPVGPNAEFLLEGDEDEESDLDVDDVEVIELTDSEYTFKPDHKGDDSTT